MLSTIEQTLERFWFRAIPDRIYSLVRITLGATGLAALIGLSDLDLYWIPGGIESPDYSALKSLFVERGIGREAGVGLFWLSVLSTLGMTIGLWTGLTIPLTFVLSLAQTSWNSLPLSAAFSVYHCLLFCLVWANAGAHWSIDRWLANRRNSAHSSANDGDLEPIWPLKLMRFQMGIIYLSTGLWKVAYPEWQTGSALHYVLAGNGFNRFAPPPPLLDPVVIASSYIILAWELLFVPLVLFKPTRRPILWFGVLAHIGMGVTMELGVFSAVMLVGYLAYLEPEWVARWSSPERRVSLAAARSET